jgi:hypothetical protein
MTFSGSYAPEDVEFLLRPIEIASTAVEEKERLIQSGTRHYSEMLSHESAPSEAYFDFFERAVRRNRRRFAADVLALARHLARSDAETIALVSLVRAGTPIGVLVRRTLARLGRSAVHYSISIIRDRGLDTAALDHILARHAPEEAAFLDGWIGKGAIARELVRATAEFRRLRGVRLPPDLYVVSDLAGMARFAPATDDYLIPSSILNATVSGLVSRSVLGAGGVGPGEFHGCVYYRDFESIDRSRWFVDEIMREIDLALDAEAAAHDGPPRGSAFSRTAAVATASAGTALISGTENDGAESREALRRSSAEFVGEACRRHGLADSNRVKVGIGETTRALLRRVPSRVFVRDPADEDVAHLVWLAGERGVPVDVLPVMPYRAATIIESLGRG